MITLAKLGRFAQTMTRVRSRIHLGVALYSGRWQHSAEIQRLVNIHRNYLIGPYNLDVVSVGFAFNTPCMGTGQFVNSSIKLWNLPVERLKAVQLDEPYRPKLTPTISLSPFKRSQLYGWQVQYTHVLEALRVAVAWKDHSYYVRTRIDLLINEVPPIDTDLVTSQNVVLAYKKVRGWAVDQSAEFFHDWIFICNRAGMETIGYTNVSILNESVRCFGACPEDQVALQLAHRDFALHALPPANMSIKRLTSAVNAGQKC